MTLLPFLGDPEPKLFGETTPPNQPDWCGAFKWLIDVGEEVYTINSS